MTKKKTKPVQEFYKAPCPSIDQILNVKKLNPKEAVVLFKKLQELVAALPKSNAITVYAARLITELVEDPTILAPYIDDEITYTKVVVDVYEAIVDIYVYFRIEYICGDMNNKLRGPSPEHPDILSMIDEAMGLPDISTSKAKDSYPRTSKELRTLEETLKRNVIGQDEAIETLIRRAKLISVGFETRGSYFFIGRTGVGKTELAKQFGERFYGNFAKINCSEYANGHEVSKLIGAPPGYVGSNAKSFFAEKSEKSNRWVFLFDEIEKGHEKLYNLLLSLLDDGTITDSQGVILDFSKSIFLFTSNQGLTELKDNNLAFGKSGRSNTSDSETLKSSLDKLFSPEFRGRIDEFIYFNDLSRDNAKKIARLNLRDYPIVVTDQILDFIIDNCYSTAYGVRDLKRFVKNNIALPVAEAILASPVPQEKGAKFNISVQDNKIVVGNLDKEWAPT